MFAALTSVGSLHWLVVIQSTGAEELVHAEMRLRTRMPERLRALSCNPEGSWLLATKRGRPVESATDLSPKSKTVSVILWGRVHTWMTDWLCLVPGREILGSPCRTLPKTLTSERNPSPAVFPTVPGSRFGRDLLRGNGIAKVATSWLSSA